MDRFVTVIWKRGGDGSIRASAVVACVQLLKVSVALSSLLAYSHGLERECSVKRKDGDHSDDNLIERRDQGPEVSEFVVIGGIFTVAIDTFGSAETVCHEMVKRPNR